MTELELKIKEAAQKYYTDGSSDLTDAEFDELVDQLRKENPESELLKRTGWGYSITNDTTPGKKYLHRYGEAGSLEKCRTWDEIRSEYKSNSIDISAKLDGLSVVLYYKDGVLDQALTRGDGRVGIDITDKIKVILGDSIPDKTFTGGVRGEILITNDSFKEFQNIHPEAKNPRNSAAGLINGKEITDDFKYLNVVVYSVVGADSWYSEGAMIPMSKVRKWLRSNFRLTAPNMNTHINSITFLENFDKLRAVWSRTYPIDGLVLTLNHARYEPGNCVIQKSQAFKFKSETAFTEVLEVEWNMSKTGYAVPRVRIEPVQLAGTTVQYCTGYNAKYILDNNLGVGAIVEIEKRGEIIPNINNVVAVAHHAYPPKFCPCCSCELQWEGVHLACKNPCCGNSVSKDTMIWTNVLAPVDNLGESLKEKFFTEMYSDVPTIEDLMSNKPTAYQNAPYGSQAYRMKLMFDKLFGDEAIKLTDAIKALNIPRFGDVNADNISQYPEQVKNLMELACDGSCADGMKLASLFEELKSKIGVANTESLEKNMDKIARLRFIQKRIDWSLPTVSSECKGKVAITGKLSVKRSDFEKELKAAGYIPAEISKDTKFLITDNPNGSSSKNKKADAWGIVKISEQQFRKEYM